MLLDSGGAANRGGLCFGQHSKHMCIEGFALASWGVAGSWWRVHCMCSKGAAIFWAPNILFGVPILRRATFEHQKGFEQRCDCPPGDGDTGLSRHPCPKGNSCWFCFLGHATRTPLALLFNRVAIFRRAPGRHAKSHFKVDHGAEENRGQLQQHASLKPPLQS